MGKDEAVSKGLKRSLATAKNQHVGAPVSDSAIFIPLGSA